MHLPAHIQYLGHHLCVEGVRLSDLAREHGTPLFVYSQQSMHDALSAYQRGLAGREHLICYAMKANSNLSILRTLVRAGCGLDIVSGGELARALASGVEPSKIIFSGVGKSRAEMRQALSAGIGCFNVESTAELDVLNAVALDMGIPAPVSIRVNPNVDAKTHPYISTGLKDNKFGIAHEEVLATYTHAARCEGLKVVGIDCHIGSQITETAPYLEAMDRMLDLVEQIEAAGVPIHHLDFGGGLGIHYQGDDQPPKADALWQDLLQRLDARGHGHRKIVIEPGRSVVGNAGVCITEVLYEKPGAQKNFLIVDAAMNDLPRPAMYQAFHDILSLRNDQTTPAQTWDVVGPVCESGDWLGRQRFLSAQAGDHLAVLSTGAYCMSMASNYNTRARAAEVLVHGQQARLIRRRETAAELMQAESDLLG